MFNLQNIIYTILHDLRILLNKILFGKRINLFCGKVFFPVKLVKQMQLVQIILINLYILTSLGNPALPGN